MHFTFSNLQGKSQEDIIGILTGQVKHRTSEGTFELQPLANGAKFLSQDIKFLYMTGGKFGTRTDVDLLKIMKSIPEHVTHLDLSNNEFHNLSPEDFAEVLRHIPPTVKSLDLGYNQLGKKSGKELALILSAIHPELETLSLFGNDFNEMPNEEFPTAFAPLTANFLKLTSFDLRGNNLGKKAYSDLEELLKAITVLKIKTNLNYNSFFDSKSRDEQNKLVKLFANYKGKQIILDEQPKVDNNSIFSMLKHCFPVLLIALIVLSSFYSKNSKALEQGPQFK